MKCVLASFPLSKDFFFSILLKLLGNYFLLNDPNLKSHIHLSSLCCPMEVAAILSAPFHGGFPFQNPNNIIIIDDSEPLIGVSSAMRLPREIVVLDEEEVDTSSASAEQSRLGIFDAGLFSHRANGGTFIQRDSVEKPKPKPLEFLPLAVLPMNVGSDCNGDAVIGRATSYGPFKNGPSGDIRERSVEAGREGNGEFAQAQGAELPVTVAQAQGAELPGNENKSQDGIAPGKRQGEAEAIKAHASKRPKSSAVRDYPEGCGKKVPASESHRNSDTMTGSHYHRKKFSAVKDVPLLVAKNSAQYSLGSSSRETKPVIREELARSSEIHGTGSDLKVKTWSKCEEINRCSRSSGQNEGINMMDSEHSRILGSSNEKDIVLYNGHADISLDDTLRSILTEKGREGTICLYTGPSGRQHTQNSSYKSCPQKKAELRPISRIGKGLSARHHVHDAYKSRIHKKWVSGKPDYREVAVSYPVSEGIGSRRSVCKDSATACNGETQKSGASARALVKQTLYDFDALRRALLNTETDVKRADLQAAGILREKGRWRNCGEKIIGPVPGIEVGDQFFFRMEMLVIGLHRQVQAGIDYITAQKSSQGMAMATSIVASGGYEDDTDDGDTFTYTGQGGNNYKGDKRQAKDQQLVRGNLAMSNICRRNIPVRVIRGSQDAVSPTGNVYTYDGLYDVVDFWFETGLSGYGVYKFKLTRRSGQPELGSSIVRFVGRLKKKGIARPNLLLEDISEGKERRPVCVVNEVDDERRPAFFNYIKDVKYPSWFELLEPPKGCDCVGGCVDEKKCLCAARNGGGFPYNQAGSLLQAKPIVYECGVSCRCPSSCHNRVSQRGLKYQLEIFKTKNRGWGVRSWDSIPSGGFVCEYTGELLSDSEAEQRTGNDEYLFDIGTKWSTWGDLSGLMDVKASTAVCPLVEDAGYTIDAKEYGNVARFINHSCSPNLYAQNVLFDYHDLRFPHVMLFSMENIPPMRELTYDYNYTVGHVRDENGEVKTKACYCGAPDCEGRLY